MTFSLRPRQKEAISAIYRAFRSGHTHVLTSLPTGFGKTVVAGKIVDDARRKDRRVLFIAHRHELLVQAEEKIRFVMESEGGDPDDVEIVKNEKQCYEAWVSIASIQRAHRWDLGLSDRDLLIVDECHHAPSSTYKKLYSSFDRHNPKGRSIGLTATAFRTDDKSLGDVYDTVAYEVDLATMIQEGFLTPLRAKIIELGVDESQLRVRHGDFDPKELNKLFNTPQHNREIVENTKRFAPNEQIVCFATSIDHAETLANLFTAAGMPAKSLHHHVKRSEKNAHIASFSRGELQVLTNVDILTEGFDAPAVSTVVMARPSMSPIFYAQAIGRALRLHPSKDMALLLDFTENSKRHVLGAPPNLEGKPKEGKPQDPSQELLFEHDEDEGEGDQVSPFMIDLLNGDLLLKPLSITDVNLLESHFAWTEISGSWILGLGINEGSLVIYDEHRTGEHCHLYRLAKDGNGDPLLSHLAGPLELSFCITLAQDEAMRHATSFSLRTRNWRNQPATDNQKKLVRKYGMPVPENLTRGQASAQIAWKIFLSCIRLLKCTG